MRVRPKKGLGQHFLRDHRVARRIVDALRITDADAVLEIGPGTGALTRYIFQRTPERFVAVELDRASVAFLQQRFPWDQERYQLLNCDILKVSLGALGNPGRWKVVGNLPYYLSSEILFWMFRQAADIAEAVIMVQREVAERCVASVGSKQYGSLSIAVQSYVEARLLFHVAPAAFTPPPKVYSSVLHFQFRQPALPYEQIQDLVRGVFQYRRKKLRNALEFYVRQRYQQALREHLPKFPETIRALLEKRPEQLSGEAYYQLAAYFARYFAAG